jgi:hypothetical protein
MEQLERWSDFNVAMVGATAALAGLLIVAMSVNIGAIVGSRVLPSRLGAAISTLVLAIVVSGVGLMPGMGLRAYGAIALIGTACASAFQARAMSLIAHDQHSPRTGRVLKPLPGLAPLVVYLVGSCLLIAESSNGLVWLASGSLLAIIGSVLMSWVVLVEVRR